MTRSIPITDKRSEGIRAAIQSAFRQDGFERDRNLDDLMEAIQRLPDIWETPEAALIHLSGTLAKAARYAAENTKRAPLPKPAPWAPR